jgi:hypothetical protein
VAQRDNFLKGDSATYERFILALWMQRWGLNLFCRDVRDRERERCRAKEKRDREKRTDAQKTQRHRSQ